MCVATCVTAGKDNVTIATANVVTDSTTEPTRLMFVFPLPLPPSPLQARTVYSRGSYAESEALCTRARGTALYAIAIGIGLGVGYGVLLGLGRIYDWY